MIRQGLTPSFLGIVAVLTTSGASGCSHKPAVPANPLPPQIVKAWTDAGAEVVWVRLDCSGYWYIPPQKPVVAPGDVPAFKISRWPQNMAGLPDPGIQFGLVLSQTDVTDAQLHELGGLKSLEALDLSYTNVTGATLKDLAGLDNLKSLSFWEAAVTDAGLKDVERLKRLHALSLGGTKVTDAGLKHLAGLNKLQTLDLWNTRITDAGLRDLAGLTNLESLELRLTEVTDTGLKELAGLKNLTTLLVGSPYCGHITDAGLKELVQLKNLRDLYLNATKVTDAGVAALQVEVPECKVHR